jgi:hypothetical protein
VSAPSGFWDGRALELNATAGASDYVGVSTVNTLVPGFSAGSEAYVFAAEWLAVVDGTGGTRMSMGLTATIAPGASSNDQACFFATGSGNWQYLIQGGGSSSATGSTGISFSLTPHRFRVELHTASSALGIAAGFAVIVFMIDGVPVFGNTSALTHPPANNLRLFFEVSNQSGNGPNLWLGPVQYGMSMGF